MSDKPDPQELRALLSRITTQNPEQPDPPESQSQEPERIIDADKILLRDGSGKSRGKISASTDGSAGLILSDNEGSAWVWLGINRDGEAFLELKDQKGEISFKVPTGTPGPVSAAGSPATVISDPSPEPASEPPDNNGASGQPASPEAATPGSGTDLGKSTPAITPSWKPGFVDTRVYDRLEELERQNRGWGFFRAAILGLLAVILGIQAFALMRPQPPAAPLAVESLAVRDHNGILRAWLGEKDGNPALYLKDRQGKLRAYLGLGADSSPALVLYDTGQRVRAGLRLGPNGEPRLDLQEHIKLSEETERHSKNATDNQQSGTAAVPGDEEGTVVGPGASAARDVSQGRDAATETYFVGSTTSNKYHYPSCKWAKTIKPSHLIKFKSVAEAQARHYIPCPVCKPPPLSR